MRFLTKDYLKALVEGMEDDEILCMESAGNGSRIVPTNNQVLCGFYAYQPDKPDSGRFLENDIDLDRFLDKHPQWLSVPATAILSREE